MNADLQPFDATEAQIQQLLGSLNVTNDNVRDLVVTARDSNIPLLSRAMADVERGLYRQAVVDLLPQIANSQYTATQVRSMVFAQMLKRAKILGYTHFEINYNLLRIIRDERLAQAHPAGYTTVVDGEDRSFLALAEAEAGLSASQVSDYMVLGDWIFPYIEQELNIDRFQVWERISSTNLRAMVPILRILINQVRQTGDDRQPQDRIRQRAEEVAIRALADEMGLDIAPDTAEMRRMTEREREGYLAGIEQNRQHVIRQAGELGRDHTVRTAVNWLLDRGENTTTNGFARLIGTREDNPFDAWVFRNNSLITFAAQMTEDQYENVIRALRARVQPHEVTRPDDILRMLSDGH